jgi:hypothetical protein
MKFPRLPPAPYLYEDVSAFAFISTGDDTDSWIAGFFPSAPTGPFSEVWRLKRSFTGWAPQMIVVDNALRMRAGREIWGLPKVLGRVSISVGFNERHVTTIVQGRTDRVLFRRLGSQQLMTFQASFDLVLPGGLTAALKFQRANTAFLASIAGGPRGYLFEFGGAAVLTAPFAMADVA